MLKLLLPLLVIAAAILMLTMLLQKQQDTQQARQSPKPQTLVLWVACTGCVAAGLLALLLF
jgi:uncharacterized membrane protein YfcA